MLRLLVDQDFDQDIMRGLARRTSEFDAITAFEAGISTLDDPELLRWAAEVGRIVVTHDRKTMPGHAARALAAGEKMAGVIVVPRKLPIAQAIEQLEIVVVCSEETEWKEVVKILPL